MSIVGIVVVSHSGDIARGTADMVRQMVGDTVPLAFCGGDPDGGLGTDVAAIVTAIEATWSEAGVAILVDLGGARLNSEMAVEMLPPERQDRIAICDAPIVEGAVMAATEASGGGSLDAVRRAAEGRRAAAADIAASTVSGRVVLRHANGLHARPSVRFTQVAGSFAADVGIAPGPDGPWFDGKSIVSVMSAEMREGTELHIRAGGGDAEAAIAALVALVADDFGMTRIPASASEPRGRIASPGVAAGPVALLDAPTARRRASGDPARERADLDAAIAAAVAGIEALARRAGGDAADMLAFQLAVLADAAIVAASYDRIAAGIDAFAAWATTLGERIAGFEASGDDYFRARATDVADVRDRVLRHLAGEADAAPPPGAILLGADITPSRFLSVDWSRGGGIALSAGSAASHAAMLARSRGVPMLVGLGPLDVQGHVTAIVDADTGRLVLSPAPADIAALEAAQTVAAETAAEDAAAARLPARTRDGVPVAVMVNVGDPDELAGLDPAICHGVGLVRTEFLFRHGLPDEETQVRAYRRIAEWAGPRPATLRTLDAGGDKPVQGLTAGDESNPFLGMRGIRLSMAHPDPFRTQLRAMARAAVHGNVRIMLPMVTLPEEIDRAAALLDAAVAELAAAGIPHARPPLGIMVEVPAVAVTPALYRRAAFFSIGSNDLVQYVTASARDIAGVADLGDPGHPAVTALVAGVVDAGRQLGIEVSLCGDMGGDPRHLPALLGAGLRALSVAPRAVGRVKRAIADVDVGPSQPENQR